MWLRVRRGSRSPSPGGQGTRAPAASRSFKRQLRGLQVVSPGHDDRGSLAETGIGRVDNFTGRVDLAAVFLRPLPVSG
jgi:hypothetical protein